MAMRYGVHRPLEDEANRLIRESLKGVTSHSAKSDILTPWKEQERQRREIKVASGSPDASTRKGMYHRVINRAKPELNSRDGIARARNISGSLAAFVQENGALRGDDE
jgi:hypothetical protein